MDSTIHSSHIDEIHYIPMAILNRPIVPELDQDKVQSLMKTFQENPDAIPPIDVLWIEGREGGNYYYSFGGCHRYHAAKNLCLEKIQCKLFKSTVEDLRSYLGSATPDLR